MLVQVQHRLFNLASQLDSMQIKLERLTTETQQSVSQVSTLTRNLTDPQALQATQEKLADFAAQLESSRERLDGLSQSVARASSSEQIQELQSRVASQEQLDTLMHLVAKQEQMERLIQMVASEERVAELAEAVQKLGRTQYKANTLLESKEAHITSAINTLQEIIERRDAIQSERDEESLQWLSEVRQSARAELTADLLPAMDGLESTLADGQQLLDQLIQTREERRRIRHQRILARQQAAMEAAAPARQGFFARLFGGNRAPAQPVEAAVQPAQIPADPAEQLDTQNIEAVEAWLRSLKLVQNRFLRLLAAEDVEIIEAEGHPFDPHLHTAVDSEATDDVKPDTVLRVLRQGYRQGDRVLRYAEVVVSRPLTEGSDAATAPDESPVVDAELPSTNEPETPEDDAPDA